VKEGGDVTLILCIDVLVGNSEALLRDVFCISRSSGALLLAFAVETSLADTILTRVHVVHSEAGLLRLRIRDAWS
jgi:hypothetical protein